MENSLQRLSKFIDFKQLSVSSFEKTVGFSNGSLGSQIKNNKTIGVDKLENILKIYPELSAEWLLTGNGKMLKFMPMSSKLPKVIKDTLTDIEKYLDESERQNQILRETTDNVPMRYTRKIYETLKQDYPDLYDLKVNLDTLLLFKDAIEEVEDKIGTKLQNAFWLYPKGKFVFKDYETQVIAALQETYIFNEALSQMHVAIIEFFRQMKVAKDDIFDIDDYVAL